MPDLETYPLNEHAPLIPKGFQGRKPDPMPHSPPDEPVDTVQITHDRYGAEITNSRGEPLDVRLPLASVSDSRQVVPPGMTDEQARGVTPARLPSASAERKSIPLCTGLLDYFPDALVAVAQCSQAGNDQHNPGQPLHWAREKSSDHPDCLVRHLMERGTVDTDGIRHSTKTAWRALALLQLEIEADRPGK